MKKEEIFSSARSILKRLTADFFLSPYIRSVIIASISSGSGITRRAPFFLVIRDAAAFAKVSISVKSSAFKSSRPFFQHLVQDASHKGIACSCCLDGIRVQKRPYTYLHILAICPAALFSQRDQKKADLRKPGANRCSRLAVILFVCQPGNFIV